MDDLTVSLKTPKWDNAESGACPQLDAAPPTSVLREEPLYRVFKATAQAFRQRALHQMRAAGIHDLFPGAAPLLMHLGEEDGQTLSELARRCELENSTLTPLVDELERAHLACRRRDVEDRRVVRIHLTEAGHALVPRLRRIWIAVQETALGDITDGELATLHDILSRIAAHLNAAE